MKIFTDKAFENRLAKERERFEQYRYIMDTLNKLTTDVNDLQWRMKQLSDSRLPLGEKECYTPR